MASEPLPNHLLSHRKRSALSQTEVAFLLGIQSAGKVCRHESFSLHPGLEAALAYEVIYRRPISELFPGVAEEIQNAVRARVKVLEQQELRSNTSALTDQKRQSLAAIFSPGTHNQTK
jgi:hypothetical protein